MCGYPSLRTIPATVLPCTQTCPTPLSYAPPHDADSRVPLSYAALVSYTSGMPSPTITVRVSPELHEAIKTRATEQGTSVTNVVVSSLTHSFSSATTGAGIGQPASGLNPTITPQTTGMTVPSPAPKHAATHEVQAGGSDSVPSLEVVKSAPVDERNRRHYAPGMGPAKTTLTPGFEVAESECTHPRNELKALSYMTTCKRCGRRLR